MATVSQEIAGKHPWPDHSEQSLVHDTYSHQSFAAAPGNRILMALMIMMAKILFEAKKQNGQRELRVWMNRLKCIGIFTAPISLCARATPTKPRGAQCRSICCWHHIFKPKK